MVLLDNETFLSRLTQLFIKSKTKGSGTVSLTMKKYDGRTGPTPKPEGTPIPKKVAKVKAAKMKKDRPEGPKGCLVRAVLQSKTISTIVGPENASNFQLNYCSILRNSMDTLKKVKKARSKAKRVAS